jgi:hypothetical protein
VLAGEGEPAVGPPQESLFFVVNESGLSPSLLSALHLEVVEESGVPLLGLGESPELPHALIVRDHGAGLQPLALPLYLALENVI